MLIPFLRVYTATIKNTTDSPLYPPARQAEIEGVKSQKVRREKIAVWQLLRRAVEDTFSRDFTSFSFEKTEKGKWTCPSFFLSLSHSENAVAVALSSHPVGVDIQKIKPLSPTIAKKVLSDREKEEFDCLPNTEKEEYILGIWTKKEAAFKRDNPPVFSPKTILLNEQTSLNKVRIKGEEYFLSVSSEVLSRIRIKAEE